MASPDEPSEPQSSNPPAEPEAEPLESQDDRRQQSADALNVAFEQLAPKAEQVRRQLRHFREGCWTAAGPLPSSGCRADRQELRQNFEELRRLVEDSEERARRDAVYPGVRAEIRRRHGLDEEAWGALLRSATETLQ